MPFHQKCLALVSSFQKFSADTMTTSPPSTCSRGLRSGLRRAQTVYQKTSWPCHHRGLHYCVPEQLLLVTLLHCHSSIIDIPTRLTAFSTTILRVGLVRFSVCNLHNTNINARHLPQLEMHCASQSDAITTSECTLASREQVSTVYTTYLAGSLRVQDLLEDTNTLQRSHCETCEHHIRDCEC